MLFQLPFNLVGEVGFVFNGYGGDTQFFLGNFCFLKTTNNCSEGRVFHSQNMLFLVSHDISVSSCLTILLVVEFTTFLSCLVYGE